MTESTLDPLCIRCPACGAAQGVACATVYVKDNRFLAQPQMLFCQERRNVLAELLLGKYKSDHLLSRGARVGTA